MPPGGGDRHRRRSDDAAGGTGGSGRVYLATAVRLGAAIGGGRAAAFMVERWKRALG